MKTIKRYTAIQIFSETVNDDIVKAKLVFGKITGPYYDQTGPEEEFDTEQEAIEYAYKYDRYASWLIIPLIRFDN